MSCSKQTKKQKQKKEQKKNQKHKKTQKNQFNYVLVFFQVKLKFIGHFAVCIWK